MKAKTFGNVGPLEVAISQHGVGVTDNVVDPGNARFRSQSLRDPFHNLIQFPRLAFAPLF
jgi:hypothetical protein